MYKHLAAHVTAAIVTLLCISCIGVLIGGLDYFATLWGEHVLEYFGALPAGWGLQHAVALMWTTVVSTAILCAPFAWIIYRSAAAVEYALGETGGLLADPRD